MLTRFYPSLRRPGLDIPLQLAQNQLSLPESQPQELLIFTPWSAALRALRASLLMMKDFPLPLFQFVSTRVRGRGHDFL